MYFERKQTIESMLYPKRVLVIYGPRRVGKTTLLNAYLASQSAKRVLSVVGDTISVQEIFASRSIDTLKRFAAPYDIIAIDEAQQVPYIGIGAKMLIDAFPEKQIILTGSSSFELSGQIGEPLTGRHFALNMLPLAQQEIGHASPFELESALEEFLIYGSYPEVLLTQNVETKIRLLNELTSSYLYKDVLALDKIKSPGLLRDIARMIAFQIGSEVSLNEIAVAFGTNTHTVARYLDLLEKMFVIRKVRGYSGNLRNTLRQKAKYYFVDNGVRNAVIGQFQPLSMRNDIGALWENFIVTEMMKKDTLVDTFSSFYFWRTQQGAEVDIVREFQGTLEAYECKWGNKKVKVPKPWREQYPDTAFSVLHRENYLDTLLP